MKLLMFLIFIFFLSSESQNNILSFQTKYSNSKIVSFFDAAIKMQYLLHNSENVSGFFEEKSRLKIGATLNYHELGTRKEDLLIDKKELTKIFVLRRILNPMGTTDAVEFLLEKLKQTKTNSDFFDSMNT